MRLTVLFQIRNFQDLDLLIRHLHILFTSVIKLHREAFIAVYGEDELKPKSHQMFHVPDQIVHLGKCLSCFVTERKHKEVKKIAVNVFRHFESTTLKNMLNNQVQYMVSGHDLFEQQFLSKVKLHEVRYDQRTFQISKGSAVCHVGEIFVNDVVFLSSGVVMEVVAFWREAGSDIVVEGKALHAVDGDPSVRSKRNFTVVFQRISDIVDVCICFYPQADLIKISVPPHALVMS